MARSAARLKMGYYPLPESEGAKLRELLTFTGPASVVDPCVGPGMIYMVGSALKARVPDALVPQTWLAQNIERFFAEYPSVQDELLFPFLETYWRRQVIANGHEFRSGASFTLRMISEAAKTASGSRTRVLLRNMDSCIPTALASDSRSWLSL